MNPDIRYLFNRLFDEIKKDCWFFCGCGFIVGLFTIWQSRLVELGFVKNPMWAKELFADFMSFNAFGLIFFGYLLIACTLAFCEDLGFSFPKLERAVSHVELRLTQIASAMLCFISGLIALVLVYSFLNLDYSGFSLIFLTVLFALFIVSSLFIALSVGRRSQPFDKWWVAIIFMMLLTIVLWWLLLQGK